jgi:hypothetical protein
MYKIKMNLLVESWTTSVVGSKEFDAILAFG